MKIHVLPGDSLVEPFKKTEIVADELIVCRECLIDGDLQAESLKEFWMVRDRYLSNSIEKQENFYRENVRSEFEKLLENAEGSEINLWFEYELFCQVNLWFCLSILKDFDSDLFVVYPKIKDEKDLWNGFGYIDVNGLKRSFENRIKLTKDNISLGAKLWKAFQGKDFAQLEKISQKDRKSFPTLKTVGKAACDIEIRPQETLERIVKSGKTEFGEVFQEFNKAEGVYGFGDLQVKKIFDELRV